jgi:hypothetical protein
MLQISAKGRINVRSEEPDRVGIDLVIAEFWPIKETGIRVSATWLLNEPS